MFGYHFQCNLYISLLLHTVHTLGFWLLFLPQYRSIPSFPHLPVSLSSPISAIMIWPCRRNATESGERKKKKSQKLYVISHRFRHINSFFLFNFMPFLLQFNFHDTLSSTADCRPSSIRCHYIVCIYTCTCACTFIFSLPNSRWASRCPLTFKSIWKRPLPSPMHRNRAERRPVFAPNSRSATNQTKLNCNQFWVICSSQWRWTWGQPWLFIIINCDFFFFGFLKLQTRKMMMCWLRPTMTTVNLLLFCLVSE